VNYLVRSDLTPFMYALRLTKFLEYPGAADEGWKVQDLNIQDLTLDIVFCDKKRPVYRGGPSDVYQGIYKEKVVALKLPRMLSSMPEQDIRRVESRNLRLLLLLVLKPSIFF